MNDLKSYLNEKPIFYKKMSYFSFYSLYNELNFSLSKNYVVQILGTNGKGTTSRFLSNLLAFYGYDVFCFNSPHLLDFNERFYYAGKNQEILNILLDDKTKNCIKLGQNHIQTTNFSHKSLNEFHLKLQNMLQKYDNHTSYFEYSLLLFMFIVSKLQTKKTIIVLEAGLGGEYDATSVVRRNLCVFSRINYDHIDVFGDNLNDIIDTKLKAMSDKNIVLHSQKVFQRAKIIKNLKKKKMDFVKTKKEFLGQNFLLAKRALFTILKDFPIKKGEVAKSQSKTIEILKKNSKKSIKSQKKYENYLIEILQNMPARCQLVDNFLLDCGHNLDCAKNHIKQIKKYFKKKPILICNFFANKDVSEILKCLKNHIKSILILDYQSDRALGDVEKICKILDISYEKIQPQNLKKYLKNELNNENFSVFGSFLVVEHFLKGYYAK